MSGPKWTEAQEAAIEARGGHLLVSAAAGSGKTAVLVERIIRLITVDGVDIDRLLVVTFTEAAAGEMRDRIMQALEGRLAANPHNGHLMRQLMLLPKASISTLHAFCLTVLRQHFYRLDLDPEFRVMDEHEAQLLRLDVLEDVLEQAYDRSGAAGPFTRLVLAYGGQGGDGDLRQLMLALHDYARSLPEPAQWLRQCAGAYHTLVPEELDASPWGRELAQLARARLARAAALLRQALGLAMGPGGAAGHAATLEQDVTRVERLEQAAAAGLSSLAAVAHEAAFPRMQAAKKGEDDPEVRKAVQKLREAAKKAVEDVAGRWLSRPLAEQVADVRRLAPLMDALVEQVLALDEQYAAAKRERGAVDFADLEHLCLRLLDDPETAAELRARFDEVLVDESQDLNGVQEAILSRISGEPGAGGRLFLVGDVKQSIYRFRQADPSLFLARYQRAVPYIPSGEPAGERRLDLQANFRSRRSVVDGVNFLFRQIMTPAAGEMAYDAAAELVYRAPYGSGGPEAAIEVHLLERDAAYLRAAVQQTATAQAAAAAETVATVELYADDGRPAAALREGFAPAPEMEAASPGEDAPADGSTAGAEEDSLEDLGALEREAIVAAQRIRDLVQGGTQVWDKAAGGYRPARYGDVVVLLRATRHKANTVLDVFSRLGVPAYAELGTGYFAALEVETMVALLAVLDNPRQDIPLAAVMRSPIGGFSAHDLARVRAARPEGDFYDAVAAGAGDESLGLLGHRLREFVERLDDWRTRARRQPLSELVWYLLTETGYFDYAGAMPGGRQRQANLRALYERARQFDGFARHGLDRFLRFIDRLREGAGDLGTAPAVGESDDVVRVMSVHKSKGLEFPIVIVLDMGRRFRQRDRHPHLAFQRDLGLGAAVVDGERRLAWPSIVHDAVRERCRREELAEEMRVLYVALTRARERLILIGSGSRLDDLAADWAAAADHSGWPLADSSLLDAGSWLDWVGPALCRHAAGAPLRKLAGWTREPADPAVAADPSLWAVHVWDAPRVAALTVYDETAERLDPDWRAIAALQPLPGVDDAPVRHALEQRIRWRYPWMELAGRPAKQSVSELKRRWEEEREESVPALRLPVRLARRPRFLQTTGRMLTAMERGTAVHLVLQHLNLDAPLDAAGVRAQVAAMTARGLLSPEQAAAVDAGQIAGFFASSLGRRLKDEAGSVLREVPFTLALPAGEVYPDLPPGLAEGERVVVQGVIDCLLVTGASIVLVDFKTDAVDAEEVAEAAGRYFDQMALYSRAVRDIYGHAPSEAYLVFLQAGKVIPVPRAALGRLLGAGDEPGAGPVRPDAP